MVDAVREYHVKDEDEKFVSLPERSDDYIQDLVVSQLERLKGIWKKAQPKVKENGEIESASEIEERMIVDREKTEKVARAATRRRSWFDRRKETLVRIVSIKREQNEADCFIWEWLLDLVETLGEDGMSSDESEIDDRTATVIYRVKNMPWRRTISEEMDLIDKQRATAHIFSKKGSKPMPRMRGGGESRRDEVEELPKGIYNKDWLKKLPLSSKDDFKFSPKKFQWLKIWPENHGK
ncbi:hypothetical protein CPB84DRAFT_1844719 [Gymnopilus junonius]|uniref:Uncharacterized protein n=1 Tax=Gymnopilus junonius TaxID=109634 RepID=A0A9P5NTK3_GYMJU|nr:hypothetical protein CPB84DRAFT_1844719 [Gymnopilus junonius]